MLMLCCAIKILVKRIMNILARSLILTRSYLFVNYKFHKVKHRTQILFRYFIQRNIKMDVSKMINFTAISKYLGNALQTDQ